eukprot:TRINITY_DN27577_c0_g1_i1.p1 TRINITY_DN27577_c0_g1~~TRINITY_DN27577_c0_g1_i1.p1  ORF type:complete len:472 (+),score=144.30 TRINITY_DN27577_c0_g1_i1:102-1517(+)
MVRILLCGDVRGDLKTLCKHIESLHARIPDPSQRFQACFCVGEFTSEDMDLDAKPPIPVYFIDAGPAASDLIEASPQGEEISSNLSFLGHFGVQKIAGLSVAYLSGRLDPELFKEVTPEEAGAADDDDEPAQRSASSLGKYGSQDDGSAMLGQRASSTGAGAAAAGPSWEDLKKAEEIAAFKKTQLFVNGCYTPLAIERLLEDIGDSGGVDLLLTSEWPTGCLKHIQKAWPQEVEHRRHVKLGARHCSSSAVADIAEAAEPKYHAVGLGGVFWRRPAWRHERRGEIVQSTGQLKCGSCRILTLGAVDGSKPGVPEGAGLKEKQYYGGNAEPSPEEAKPKKPEKWLHGLELDPNAMPAAADDATPSPFKETADEIAAKERAEGEKTPAARADFADMSDEEKRSWARKFGIDPRDMQKLADKIAQANAPKEKIQKDKRKSLYKVSEKEKKARKTGGDGHLPFHAKERMANNRG